MPRVLSLFALTLVLALPLSAQTPSIADKTAGMTRLDGFFALYRDDAEGLLYLEIPRMEEPFLYQISQPAGLGSNDIGLDRGQLGETYVVHFERVGPKVLLVAPNLRYRASSASEAERASVRGAFAEGILWGFTVAAESGARVLVDVTPFVVRDAHGVVQSLKQARQGAFRVESSRSALAPDRTRAFPDNTEMEARLTFVSDEPGALVRSVAADAQSVTLRVRHSFVRLPDPGYTPRRFHPGSGFFGVQWQDYSAPIGEEMTQRFLVRHRLACAGPRDSEGLCAPARPIVYFLDPGTPEPVRSALLDGARWWAEAFVAAGFRDAFRVEMLPDTADPLDVRYNVIQWVHRSTRGWSYGASAVDPRTGEILKGHVSLGSLRVRQDYLLAEGLLAPYEGDNTDGFDAASDPMLAMALARIRQLSAHEVGHTIGLAHNYAASINSRASVMDYPAPLARLAADGAIDLSDAYATGIGAWDKAAVRYGYTHFAPGADEHQQLDALLADTRAAGLLYLSDRDNAGALDARGSQWENGADVLANLREILAVRRAALARFDARAIRPGRPLSTLEDALVPLYLGHRYAAVAAAKLLGGQTYAYALRGDTQAGAAYVEGSLQRQALDALLATLTPESLRLPPALHAIPPPPPGYGDTREYFAGRTGLAFDPYAPAEAATALVLSELTRADRAARLAYQATLDASLPGLDTVWDEVTARLWQRPVPADAQDAHLTRLVQGAWAEALMALAARTGTAPAVQVATYRQLTALAGWLAANSTGDAAHRSYYHDRLQRFLDRPFDALPAAPEVSIPPGPPIGSY